MGKLNNIFLVMEENARPAHVDKEEKEGEIMILTLILIAYLVIGFTFYGIEKEEPDHAKRIARAIMWPVTVVKTIIEEGGNDENTEEK